jgi:hypothetical protein
MSAFRIVAGVAVGLLADASGLVTGVGAAFTCGFATPLAGALLPDPLRSAAPGLLPQPFRRPPARGRAQVPDALPRPDRTHREGQAWEDQIDPSRSRPMDLSLEMPDASADLDLDGALEDWGSDWYRPLRPRREEGDAMARDRSVEDDDR